LPTPEAAPPCAGAVCSAACAADMQNKAIELVVIAMADLDLIFKLLIIFFSLFVHFQFAEDSTVT
jgi:hypothetical protein